MCVCVCVFLDVGLIHVDEHGMDSPGDSQGVWSVHLPAQGHQTEGDHVSPGIPIKYPFPKFLIKYDFSEVYYT